MPPNLRRLAKVVDRLAAGFAELQGCIGTMIEAEARPKTESSEKNGLLKKPRAPRWTGPVPVEIRKQRQEAWSKRSRRAIEAGIDPRPKFFGVMHNLHPCLVSKWLTAQPGSIAPGSAQDQNMWRMVLEDIAKFEAIFAKRHGAVQIANSAARVQVTMTA